MNGHIEDRLVAYVDGELTADEARAVDAHLATCARCADALEELRAVTRVLESDVAERPLAPMWEAIGARAGRRFPVFDAPFATATAAALAIGMILGVMTFDRATRQPSANGDLAAATETWSAESEVLLSDAYLSINPDSEAGDR